MAEIFSDESCRPSVDERLTNHCLLSVVSCPLPGGGSEPVEIRRPSRLNALTGLRCFAAVNIVLFHFANPHWFDFRYDFRVPVFSEPTLHFKLLLAPVIDAGYVAVSYFILLSGYVLGYNYNAKARAGQLEKKRFWKARFSRIYPIYLLSLLLAWEKLPSEYASHTHGMFWAGVVLTPLLLQGWIPAIATFLNTPAWTMSAEAFYYFIFPWIAAWKETKRLSALLWKMAGVWILGMIPGALYMLFSPDGISNPSRWSYGPWLWALKYTPYAHLFSFIFGVMLADLNGMIAHTNRLRFWLALGGFGGIYGLLTLGPLVPYAIIHDGLLMPLFACIILGLSGDNLLSRIIGCRPLVFIGMGSYSLYLLHFNLWNILHGSHVLNLLGLARFDPWISYVLLIGLALLVFHTIERPAQRQLRKWMNANTAQ
jgi:peptidoglycan/LPS O-acetylase OafA/YrhL